MVDAVSLTLILAGTVSDFDAGRLGTISTAFASYLNLTSPDLVETSVTAASVRIATIITPPPPSANASIITTNTIIEQLRPFTASASYASSVLSVHSPGNPFIVERIEPPTVVQRVEYASPSTPPFPPPPPTPLNLTATSSNQSGALTALSTGATSGVVIAIAAALLLLCGLYCLRRRRLSRDSAKRNVLADFGFVLGVGSTPRGTRTATAGSGGVELNSCGGTSASRLDPNWQPAGVGGSAAQRFTSVALEAGPPTAAALPTRLPPSTVVHGELSSGGSSSSRHAAAAASSQEEEEKKGDGDSKEVDLDAVAASSSGVRLAGHNDDDDGSSMVVESPSSRPGETFLRI